MGSFVLVCGPCDFFRGKREKRKPRQQSQKRNQCGLFSLSFQFGIRRKVDLVEKDPSARQVLFDAAAEFARTNNLFFSEASAVTSLPQWLPLLPAEGAQKLPKLWMLNPCLEIACVTTCHNGTMHGQRPDTNLRRSYNVKRIFRCLLQEIYNNGINRTKVREKRFFHCGALGSNAVFDHLFDPALRASPPGAAA